MTLAPIDRSTPSQYGARWATSLELERDPAEAVRRLVPRPDAPWRSRAAGPWSGSTSRS